MKTVEELVIEARRLLGEAMRHLEATQWTDVPPTEFQRPHIAEALSVIQNARATLAPATIKRDPNAETS